MCGDPLPSGRGTPDQVIESPTPGSLPRLVPFFPARTSLFYGGVFPNAGSMADRHEAHGRPGTGLPLGPLLA